MARALHVRLDDDSELALSVVKARDGMNDSEAVRAALREAAERRRTRAALREEVARIAADEAEQREIRAISEEMDELAPPWPEW